jgi:hypothetical protein
MAAKPPGTYLDRAGWFRCLYGAVMRRKAGLPFCGRFQSGVNTGTR